MLLNVNGLPGVVDPDVTNGAGGVVAFGDHVVGESALLGLVLVVQDKDAKLRLGLRRAIGHLLAGLLDVLLELLDGVLEGGAGVIHLVDNQDALANQVLHVAQGREIEPLRAGDLGAGRLDLGVLAELLVQREANGLDGDVGRPGLLEERAQDACGDVAATADSNHELGLEFGEQPVGRLLAQVVHLHDMAVLVFLDPKDKFLRQR